MNRSEVATYYAACERLDEARRQSPPKPRRISMLTYAVGVTLDRAQDALAGRERSVDEKLHDMIEGVRLAFGTPLSAQRA